MSIICDFVDISPERVDVVNAKKRSASPHPNTGLDGYDKLYQYTHTFYCAEQ